MSDHQATQILSIKNSRLTVTLLLAIFAIMIVALCIDIDGRNMKWDMDTRTALAEEVGPNVTGNLREALDQQSDTTRHLPPSVYPSTAQPSHNIFARASTPILIGVLAHKGMDVCREMWQPTIAYLDKALPGRHFDLVPLPFDDVESAVKDKSIDFLICNSAIYVDLEVRYGVSRTMTLRNRVGTQIVSEFGGVIFSRADRSDLQSLRNARGQRLAAVEQTSFGGWLMALREFKAAGIDPERDCARLVFLNSHPAVVRSVLSGEADIGTVRTDTIERMVADGEIRMDAIRVIPGNVTPGPQSTFPYVHSTRLYPEWPFAKLSDTNEELSRELTVALLSMPADSPAAKAAQSGGWGVCLNYTSVHDCLREIRMPPYEHYGKVSWSDMWRQYWPWLVMIASLIIALLGALLLLRGKQLAVIRVSRQNRLLLASAGEGICGVDVKGTTTFVNPAASKMLGYTAEELLGKNLHTLTHHTKPDGQPYPIHECPIYMTCNDGTVHQGSDEFFYRKDGSIIPISYSSLPIFDNGRINGAVTCFQDITERKRAEDALRESETTLNLLLETIPIPVFYKDRDGRYLGFNKAFEIFFGISKDQLIGKNVFDISPPELAKVYHAKDVELFEKPRVQIYDSQVLDSNGDLHNVIFHKASLTDTQGSVTGLIGAVLDITERKQAEAEKAELEVQNRQLQKAESLGRMAGAIAHHFNNQLYAVMGNLEMAMDDLPRGADISEALAEAQKAAHKAAEVSRLMLTYLGQTPGNQEPIDLSEAFSKCLPLLQAAIPKGITINTDLPSSGPVIRADISQIHQIITNLATNAWESISDNRGSICLTIKTVSHSDIPTSKRFPIDWQPQEIDYACLEVSDSGSGIANKDIEKIFDPFFTTKFTGRGLGLPVVMGIVKAHAGGVTVESEQVRGSVFRVFFPVSNEELPSKHDIPAIPGALQTSKAEKISKIEGGGTVLLIEDEDQVRNITKIMLTRLGYTVLEAKDGVEALEIFQQHQDDIRCVLSDLTMPRMDGWDTLAALRQISPDIPVILSSGYDEAQVMAEEHCELPNAFLGKPYRLTDLDETIGRVLAKEASRSSLVELVKEVASLQSF